MSANVSLHDVLRWIGRATDQDLLSLNEEVAGELHNRYLTRGGLGVPDFISLESGPSTSGLPARAGPGLPDRVTRVEGTGQPVPSSAAAGTTSRVPLANLTGVPLPGQMAPRFPSWAWVHYPHAWHGLVHKTAGGFCNPYNSSAPSAKVWAFWALDGFPENRPSTPWTPERQGRSSVG